jgi:hypothetical protein
MDKIELYAKMFNTLMEMAWTIEDEDLNDDIKQDIIRITDAIDDCVLKSDEFSEQEKKVYEMLTDNIADRIYFNI